MPLHNGAPIFEKSFITPLGGYAVQFVNKTGANSVYGTVCEVSATTFRGVQLEEAGGSDPLGIMYGDSNGNPVADGANCYVVVGGPAEILLENTTAATVGNWVKTSDNAAGRCDATTAEGSIPGLTFAEHFREIGHCLQTISSGTDVLALVNTHFN
jgi:hypothetical protein